MQNIAIVKLGGSIITNKGSGKPAVDVTTVKRIAREIAHRKKGGLVLLYGAGSFGHPLAHKYRLSGRALSKEALFGAGLTVASMRKLGNILADIFLSAGVPVVPLQTSACVEERSGALIFSNFALIESILKKGGIPLLGGDVVIADGCRTAIASADRLAVALTQHFKSKRILFATDVDGVYAHFPPAYTDRPLTVIVRKDFERAASKKLSEKNATDVTGAMVGKLRALLPLKNCVVVIFSGLTPGVLGNVLRGRSHGTRIEL